MLIVIAKNALSAFLKETEEPGRVDDFGTQGDVKFRSW